MFSERDSILKKEDILPHVERSLGPGQKRGKWHMFVCPFHDDHDPSLGVVERDGSRPGNFQCFGCGVHGNLIDWVIRDQNLDFRSALEYIRNDNVDRSHKSVANKTPKESVVDRRAWELSTAGAVASFEHRLWTSDGDFARAYLHRRGIKDETAKKYRLGYSKGGKSHGLFVPPGIVIPWIVNSKVTCLKIRLLSGHGFKCRSCGEKLFNPGNCPLCDARNKYRGVKGNRSDSIFGLENIRSAKNAVLCEGEFDTMILDQECSEVAGVATLGSAGTRLDVSRWGGDFLHLERIVTTYHLDNAGLLGASRIEAASNRIVQCFLPEIDNCKDVNDIFLAGGDLRTWLENEFIRLQHREYENSSALGKHLPISKPKMVRTKIDLNEVVARALSMPMRIDSSKPCYWCGSMDWYERTPEMGGGWVCNVCHPGGK